MAGRASGSRRARWTVRVASASACATCIPRSCRGYQYAAPGTARKGVSARGGNCAGPPGGGDLGYRRSAADLPWRVSSCTQRRGPDAGDRYRRRQLDGFSAAGLPSPLRKPALRLTVLFRLAVLPNRSRRVMESPPVHSSASGKRLEVRFDRTWLQENHLTRADLEQERVWLKSLGLNLRVGYQEASESSCSSVVCADTAASPSCGLQRR